MAKESDGCPSVYPKGEILQVLSSCWAIRMASPLRRPPRAPAISRKDGGTVMDVQPELSSQQAVAVLIDLESILGFRPKTSVIRHGGYRGLEQFIRDLSGNVESSFNEHHNITKSDAKEEAEEKEVSIHAEL